MKRLRTPLLLLAVLIIAALVIVAGILPRLHQREALRRETDYIAAPTVTAVRPARQAPAEEVVLPGNIQAFTDAAIYARTNGYLRKWYFDIGAHVKKGQLLAEIESPEVDQQLQQAREDRQTAEANLKLAQLTAARYTDLFKTDSVAKQEVDNAVQDAAAKASLLKSAQANVGRLEKMVSFEKLYVPFDGLVTARNTDMGQLIESGSAGGPTRELFHVASIDKLRVFVNVPQAYSHETKPGMKVDLTLPEMPGKRIPGTLTRTANSFDPATRTLLVEVDVVNTGGLLFPGAYTETHFKVNFRSATFLVPPTALVFRSEGLRAATVVNGNRAALVPVTLGRDFGTQVEVISGLSENSMVIENPPDSLVDGESVRVVPPTRSQKSQD
ncbi:MAG: putative Co/Zn/Cd efflux system rane fusion protein [Bryobacterales bacterium]|jgi:RND family efflux transporter MFP subunit|nr:putative Co/Zn/Cd efflux system rane fusion protein [Bryobacterales bacterium]